MTMTKKAVLVLEDGTFYEGTSFGAAGTASGEIVFITSMTGYQEMLSDPSFAGQVVVPTYPLIGNYGINDSDFESAKIQVRGFVVREYCPQPSHWQSRSTLNDYLVSGGIPGISGIDTRSLTRHIRSLGVMPAVISTELTVGEAVSSLKKLPLYGATDFVREVSAPAQYPWQSAVKNKDGIKLVIVDMGLRYNIARIFDRLGCGITIVPCTASAIEIRKLSPDGVVLSPGPGDPALMDYLIENVLQLLGQVPVMGICLGHQLVGRALGANTFKLKFGHRGANHPVRDLESGRVYITTQNHGYALDLETLSGGLEASYINLNDGTVEGLRHKDMPLISIQYHAEGSPGPMDSTYLFQRFIDLIKQGRKS